MLSTEVERDGKIHPCNGYILVEPQEEKSEIVIIRDPSSEHFRAAVVLELSGDDTEHFEVNIDGFEWKLGDLIYFKECIDVDGHIFVHWTDVVAYRRI